MQTMLEVVESFKASQTEGDAWTCRRRALGGLNMRHALYMPSCWIKHLSLDEVTANLLDSILTVVFTISIISLTRV